MSTLNSKVGKGKELRELLQRELGIPEKNKSFTVRFDTTGLVTVTCEFLAQQEPVAESLGIDVPKIDSRYGLEFVA